MVCVFIVPTPAFWPFKNLDRCFTKIGVNGVLTFWEDPQNEKKFIGIAIFIIMGFWVAPYFILGQNAYMRVLDNLDSNIAWYKVLKDSGELFGPLNAHIPQIINGELSRNAFYSQFYGVVILFSLFPPMVAYGLSQAITRFFAFLGMYLLLRDHTLSQPKFALIRVGVAFTFALTPYWPSGMLSTLGMPLALWAFLSIRKGKGSWKSWLTLTLLPFYSSFMLGFFFFLSAMGIWWFVDLIRKKRLQFPLVGAIFYMTLIYLLIDYRLVASLLMPNHEATNRSVFYESRSNFVQTLRLFVVNYVVGHNQDQAVHIFIILPLSLLILGYLLLTNKWRLEKSVIFLNVLNLALSAWYAFWFFKGWQPLKETYTILTIFNFSRYHYLRPMVLYLIFALSLSVVWKLGKRWARQAVGWLLLAQFLVLIPYNEQIYYHYHHHRPTFKQFFAEKEFQQIKAYIGRPVSTYRVVSIGMHPDIAQYNGFYTLDTYNNFYPLTYKRQFRKIIASELAKNPTIRTYFDDWGGRCYIFTAELGRHYMFSKHTTKTIKHLNLNTNVLKQMGGRYVLSAVKIENANATHLKLLHVFDQKEAYWRIYLYKVL